MVMDAPPDMSEVFELTRDDQIPAARVVETKPVYQGMGPVVVYSTAPFRPYVPPPLAPAEPESEARSRWRLDRFRPLGILVSREPYPTPWGLHWTARLLWPGMEWNPKKSENHNRHFAVSLDDGTWSHVGTHQQERPFAELAAYLNGLAIPRYLEETPPESPAAAEADLAPPVETSLEEPTPAGPPVPAAPAAINADHASYLAECEAAGLTVERSPWDAEGTSFHGRFRGLPLTVHPRSRSVVFGLKVSGGRCYTPMPLTQAIEAINAECAKAILPQRAQRTQRADDHAISTPEASVLSVPSVPSVPSVAQDPSAPTRESTSPAAGAPSADSYNRQPTAHSLPQWLPAATAEGTGRFFRTLVPIPRVGGELPAGIDLELLAFTRPDRGNFSRDGRLVLSDCPLDRFTEVLCA